MAADDEQLTESAGQRIAAQRKLAGLSQAQLAAAANYSASMISQVERGVLPASPALVSSVARALGTSTADLLALPYPARDRAEHAMHASVHHIRRELRLYHLPPGDDVAPRALPELEVAVAQISHLRHEVDLDRLGAELPGLLAELREATYYTHGHDRARVFGLLAETYYAAGQHVWKLGHQDLASTTVDRFEWAAAQSDDELLVHVGNYRRAGDMIVDADWAPALHLLDRSRRTVEPNLHAEDPPTLSMWGNLHLKSGLAAARAGNRSLADDHLAEARETARRIGVDRDDYRLCFGPTNVDIWGVALAVEASDGTTAVKRAAEVKLPPTTPRERAGHHWIDVGRGFLLHGDRARSLEALQQARRVCPQQTRYHPQVHETVRSLAEADRRATDSLAGFARWAGVMI